MQNFVFVKPGSLSEVSRVLADQGGKAKLAAGCTDIIPALRRKAIAPEVIVSIKAVQGMAHVTEENAEVKIGAVTTMSEIASSEIIKSKFPALATAAASVGSTLIQNTATIGGNICNASPAADTAPPLLIYGARVKIFNQGFERIVKLSDFFTGVGKTVLVPGDVVTEIILPLPDANSSSIFVKQGRRKALEISILSVAVKLTIDKGGKITDAALAYGAVAPTPVLAVDAAARLVGKMATSEAELANALAALDNYVKPITDIRGSAEYRKHMAVVLTRRAIGQLVQNRQGKGV